MNSITPQERGRQFETTVHYFISQTKCIIMRENDIIKKYGVNNKGIDHLIYVNNYIICIQDKWMSSKPSLSCVHHFIKCVENISEIEKCKCIGIYLSNLPLTSVALQVFDIENWKNKNHYVSIYDENEEKLLKKLMKMFYKNKIWFFEQDGCCIML